MKPLINPEEVTAIFTNCLFKDEEIKDPGELPENGVAVEGIVGNFGLHKGRLEKSREAVKDILRNLKPGFHKQTGGGWSFLNMCNDKNDVQWTGFHKVMNELVVLSIGLGLGEYCAPKEMWSALPGGMPYVVFDIE